MRKHVPVERNLRGKEKANLGVWDEGEIQTPEMSLQWPQHRALTSPYNAGSRTLDYPPYPSPKDHHLILVPQEQTALRFAARILRPVFSRKCLLRYQQNCKELGIRIHSLNTRGSTY